MILCENCNNPVYVNADGLISMIVTFNITENGLALGKGKFFPKQKDTTTFHCPTCKNDDVGVNFKCDTCCNMFNMDNVFKVVGQNAGIYCRTCAEKQFTGMYTEIKLIPVSRLINKIIIPNNRG